MTATAGNTAGLSAQLVVQTQILGDLRNAWLQTAAAAHVRLRGRYRRERAEAPRRPSAASRCLGGALRITGTALHWIIAGTFEFLAVAIPAAYALAAGLLVASDAAQNVQQHISALNTAVSATGGAFAQSTGSVLGLGNALQQAQDAAAPGVYTILGAAINTAKTRMGGFAVARPAGCSHVGRVRRPHHGGHAGRVRRPVVRDAFQGGD